MSSRFLDKALDGLKAYVPGEQPDPAQGLIKLNTNESPFPPTAAAVSRAADAAAAVHLYSDPDLRACKQAFAAAEGLTPDMVSFTNGSDEALAFLAIGFCQNGAVCNDITYGFYAVICALFKLKTHIVPLRDDLTVDIDAYRGATGTVFLANPNAPTGIALPQSDIVSLLVQDRNRLIVVDEAYAAFGAQSCLPLIKAYDNLVVVSTFSKSRSLAGARLGAVAAHPSVMADFERIRCSFNPYNVNAMTLAMGQACLTDADTFQANTAAVIQNRERLTAGLRAIGFTVPDSKANFVFAAPPDGQGGAFYAFLREQGILVRHFDAPRTAAFVRITVGDTDGVAAVLAASERYCKRQG